jgi:hypothetical protein
MNNLYLLNEDTKFQLGCNEVCRRIYNHLASLHVRWNIPFQRQNHCVCPGLLGKRNPLLAFALKDAKVITITRRGGYYDFDVNHNVSFITSNH